MSQAISIGIILTATFFHFYRLADLPLGLFFDSAVNGLDAVRLIQRGGTPLYFPSNGGREALFVYLLLPFLKLFGTTPFALRLLTAMSGVLTVALLLGFLRHLPSKSPTASRFTLHASPPSLAALTLALSYWNISVNRLGLRATLVSLVIIPLFWAFLTGWATRQKRYFLLAGILMGLAGYTYSATRLLPIILLLALLPEFFPGNPSQRLKQYLVPLLIFSFSAAVVYAPLGLYFWTHPAQFNARTGTVMIWHFLTTPGQIMAELGRNSLRVISFFCCSGNPNPIFGLPEYPGSPLILAPFLLMGLLHCLYHWRDLFSRLIALWWLIGAFASIIAIEAPHPLRMVLALVPTAILIALGLHWGSRWLHELWRPKAQIGRVGLTLLPVILIILPTFGMIRAYFMQWPALSTTQGIYDYGAVAIRDKILESAPENLSIYLPLERLNAPPLLFYLSHSFARQARLTVPEITAQVMVILPEKMTEPPTWVQLYQGQMTIIPPLSAMGEQQLQTAISRATAEPINTIRGETVAQTVRLDFDPAQHVQQPNDPLTTNFGAAQLIGASYTWEIETAALEIPVTLYWQTKHPIRQELDLILHLVDDQRRSWGSANPRPLDWVYPTTFWQPDSDHIATSQTIIIDQPPLPPGRYWVAISLADPTTASRLPLIDSQSEAPDTHFVGPLKVSLPPIDQATITAIQAETPTSVQGSRFGESIQLSGLALSSASPQAGETVTLSLLWQASTTPKQDYTVFIHLLDENDSLVAGNDAQPRLGRYPTSMWSEQEWVQDEQQLTLPSDLPGGSYRLALGLYHQPSGERLAITLPTGDIIADGRLILPNPLVITPPK